MVIKNTVPVADTSTTTEIFYPETDGMPLPDGEYQLRHFVNLIAILKHFFRNCLDVWASGNTFMYYVEGNPRISVSPDCYVAFGVDTDLILSNNNYRVWDMGKAPDFALEIGSPSTWRNDLGPKRDLYARLGIGEYWKFDPSGGDHYGEPLVGEVLVDGEYRRMEMNREPDGRVWGHSPRLNLELHWVDGRLRFYDPVGCRWLQNMTEMMEDTETERAARESAEAVLDAERAARESAEARLAEMEAELRRLRTE
ncbi:MAG: Uma2 family endonuclease [Dehalococcoidia bacterium]|nr:Uma2 family endonuclease [Dehalococcoidia bacterium]